MGKDHILVIHIACGDSHEDEYNHQENEIRIRQENDDKTGRRSYQEKQDPDALASLPLQCDLLLMPELPVNHSDVLLNLTQVPLNPCGLPNVLLLNPQTTEAITTTETTSSHATTSSPRLLLSLSSCVLPYRDIFLPIDLLPSTFDFDPSEGAMETTDLSATLSFSIARQRIAEYHQQEHSTLQGAEQRMLPSDDMLVPVLWRSNEWNLPIVVSVDEESQCPPRSPQGTRPSNSKKEVLSIVSFLEQHPVNNTRLEFELEALQRVQAMMDRDSENLDRLLQVLSWVGMGLLLGLIWSGYQLYLAKKQAQRHPLALSQYQTAQCKILLQSALASSPWFSPSRHPQHRQAIPPQAIRHAPSSSSSTIPPSNPPSVVTTPRADNRSRHRRPKLHITPTRLDFSTEDEEEKKVLPPPSQLSDENAKKDAAGIDLQVPPLPIFGHTENAPFGTEIFRGQITSDTRTKGNSFNSQIGPTAARRTTVPCSSTTANPFTSLGKVEDKAIPGAATANSTKRTSNEIHSSNSNPLAIPKEALQDRNANAYPACSTPRSLAATGNAINNPFEMAVAIPFPIVSKAHALPLSKSENSAATCFPVLISGDNAKNEFKTNSNNPFSFLEQSVASTSTTPVFKSLSAATSQPSRSLPTLSKATKPVVPSNPSTPTFVTIKTVTRCHERRRRKGNIARRVLKSNHASSGSTVPLFAPTAAIAKSETATGTISSPSLQESWSFSKTSESAPSIFARESAVLVSGSDNSLVEIDNANTSGIEEMKIMQSFGSPVNSATTIDDSTEKATCRITVSGPSAKIKDSFPLSENPSADLPRGRETEVSYKQGDLQNVGMARVKQSEAVPKEIFGDCDWVRKSSDTTSNSRLGLALWAEEGNGLSRKTGATGGNDAPDHWNSAETPIRAETTLPSSPVADVTCATPGSRESSVDENADGSDSSDGIDD